MDVGFDDLNFMDDGICWASSTKVLQKKVDSLTAVLSEWGLTVNAAKTRLLVWGDCGGRSIRIGDNVAHGLDKDTPLTIMGIPRRPGGRPVSLPRLA